MPNDNVSSQLPEFIERLESLAEEKDEITDRVKEVKAEMKGLGFDMNAVAALLKIRKKGRDAHEEEQSVLELYLDAMG